MPKEMLWDAFVSINGVDLSDHVKSVELPRSREVLDSSAMGALGKGKIPGLKDDKFTVNWLQSFTAAKVDATLSPLYDNGTAHAVEIRKSKTDAVSATNPKWTSSTVYLIEYQPIAGEVGSIHEVPSTFEVDGVLTRATA